MNVDLIAYNIKFLREQRNWTQQKLADQLTISRSTVAKWENDQLTPDIYSLIKLCNIFEITLDQLAGNTILKENLLLDFKRMYHSQAVEFDDDAVALVEYIMKFPDFKEQIHRLSKLTVKKQLSIHKLIESLIEQYEKF